MAKTKMHPESDSRKPLTAERLRELLHYAPDTGVFTWIKGQRAGFVAGFYDHAGYRKIFIDGRSYMAHRLAWLYVTGEWPLAEIDHKNCVRDDNRLANLREASRLQNNRNACTRSDNTSGYKGVSFSKATGRWRAVIDGRHLGLFDAAAEAHAAYCMAATELHGEFYRG